MGASDKKKDDRDAVARVSDETKAAERREATMPADAGGEPTPEEAAAAEQNELDPQVAKSNQEALERGANARGEGRVS